MPLEQVLIDLMLDEVTVELASLDDDLRPIRDKYGEITYEDAEEGIQCQVTRNSRRTIGKDGTEVTSRVQIIFADPELALTEDARITLADGDRLPIIRLMKASDQFGPYLLEAWC